MSYTFEVSDRLYKAAEEWAERRFEEIDDALATKVEQSLLEIEHLVAQAHEVEFEVDGREITYEPSETTAAFISEQAETAGVDESTIVKLHVDLYANTFLEEAKEEDKPRGTAFE